MGLNGRVLGLNGAVVEAGGGLAVVRDGAGGPEGFRWTLRAGAC